MHWDPQLIIAIFLRLRVLGPPPGPGSIPCWPGRSQAAGLSLRNQLQSPPPGPRQPECPQSVPVETGVESGGWLHSIGYVKKDYGSKC